MGEFNGGCAAANGCREQPPLTVILKEGNLSRQESPAGGWMTLRSGPLQV